MKKLDQFKGFGNQGFNEIIAKQGEIIDWINSHEEEHCPKCKGEFNPMCPTHSVPSKDQECKCGCHVDSRGMLPCCDDCAVLGVGDFKIDGEWNHIEIKTGICNNNDCKCHLLSRFNITRKDK